MHPRAGIFLIPLLLVGSAFGADDSLVPPADGKPILQLDAGGPMAAVTALGFAPNGKTLYAGGFDKVVRAWTLDEKTGEYAAHTTYHIPIGPGINGLINALAVSPDGRWLAVAGSGAIRGTAGFGETGIVEPLPGRLSPAMENDWGAIYLFDLSKDKEAVTPLRGHRAPVLRLKFLPDHAGKPPLLVSVGRAGKGSMEVRLWDTAAGRLLAEHGDLPDPGGNEPPGLDAWHTGPKPKDVGVAVALTRDFRPGKDTPPGQLHYWDAGADQLHSTELDPSWQFTNTAAFRISKPPYGGVLFTGGVWLKKDDSASGGYMRGWPMTDDGPQKDSDLMERLNNGALKTLVFLPKPGGGPLDLAAGVEQMSAKSPFYQLTLIGRTAAGAFGQIKASARLWDAAGPVAVTAVSPTGDRLAISGGADHDVWIFSIDDLLQKKTEPLQKLHSTGAHMTGVAFVRKGNVSGLLLRQDRPGGEDTIEWVLDSGGQGVQDGRKGWENDAPDTDGWEATPGPDKSFVVEKDKKKVGRVHLATGQPATFSPLLTHYALLPPCKPLNRAFLAVGYIEQGASYLELFDVAADRRVRRFTGHVNAIRDLAFTKDGRLLASASEDQTVAVWSLTDLDKVVAKGGAVPGFLVEQKDNKVVVAALHEGDLSGDNKKAVADKGVAAGAAIEGVVVAKNVKAFRSPQDFYDAAWAVKPGDPLVLRIAGADVSLTTDQGEDERKPLFSFFMSTAARNRLWVAWTPIGPYDTADQPAAEKVIGWHSNTGKASAPVEFSPASQYRKESYRPGLLKYLMAAGDVSDALKKWNDEAAPKPGMGLRLEAPGTQFPQDGQGRSKVQGPPKGLTLRAELFGILASKVRRVRWRFDSGAWRDFDRQSELGFTAELDKANLDWQGRPHEFSVLAESLEAGQTEYTRRLPVYYAPPPPEITSEVADAAEVADQEFAFKAAAAAGKGAPADAKVQATVRLNNGEPKEVGTEIREKFHLEPGDNFIEVRATNAGAAPELAGAESTAHQWRVRYTPSQKLAPPTVYLESASSASEKPQDGKPLVVHTRTVRVRGRITSASALLEASCDGRKLASLDAPDADKLNLPIDEQITLKPGSEEQTVKFVARRDKADPTTKTLVLKYEPPAPRFEFDPGAPPKTVPGSADKVTLGGRIIKDTDDLSEFKVEVRLNGKAIDGVKRDGDRLDAAFSPRPGDNLIEVVLDSRIETAHCLRLRPPVVNGLTHSDPGAGAFVTLTALVQSPADRPLTGGRVSSDAVDGESPKFTLTAQPPLATGADPQTWKVVATDVRLKSGGKNQLSLWARNEDGESEKSAETAVALSIPAPQAAPTVEVLEPRVRDEVVQTPLGRLAFRVHWHGPKGTVAVLVNDHEQDLKAAGVASIEPDADGVVTYRTETLPLESGPNILRIAAVNADGMKAESEPYTVFYLRGTAFIRLTGLSATRQAAAQLKPSGRGDQLQFPRQDAAEVWVHGEVEWADAADPVLAQEQPPHLRVWVNDFEQFETPLAPRQEAGRTRRFAAPLRLNNSVNKIEIGSSDVKVEKVAFTVQCSQPARDQRLHLLVVAPNKRDEAKVAEEVLTAFQARHIDGDHFDTAAFRDGRMYGPVIKLAQREEVFDAVENMKGAISGGADELNDVIVVFFQGQQIVTENEHFLLTGETTKLLNYLKPGDSITSARLDTLKETALTCDKFRELLADIRGAKLVLLDAQDPVGEKDAKNLVRGILDKAGTRFPKIGCLDYVLLGAESSSSTDHLIALLRKSLDQTSSLKDLIGKEDAWSSKPNQLFRCYVPEGLLTVNLGQIEK